MDEQQNEKVCISLKAIASKGDIVSIKFPAEYPYDMLARVSEHYGRFAKENGFVIVVGREGEFDLTKLDERQMNKAGWYKK